MKTQVKALKVKIKSLAAEAKIIRLEERKVLGWKKPDGDLYRSLREHRITDVRKDQRASMPAYGYIRGVPYSAIEKPNQDNPPDLARVRQLVTKFGSLPTTQTWVCRAEDLEAWRTTVVTPAKS